jgi:type VI protein secretion system component Hcp
LKLARVLFPLAAAAVVTAFAPRALADGVFVTFTNAAGQSTARLPAAVVTTSNASDVAVTTNNDHSTTIRATKTQCSAHVEIDSFAGSASQLVALQKTGSAKMTAKIEYTTPNAQGVEVVTLVATLGNVAIGSWSGTYTAGSPSTSVQSIDLKYLSETLVAPASTTQPAPSVTPQISRAQLVKVANLGSLGIDDAYIQVPGIAGESTTAGHSGQTRLLSATWKIGWSVAQLGAGTTLDLIVGGPTLDVKVSKAMGASSPAFVAAQAQGAHQTFATVPITFVGHAITADITRFSLQLNNAWVKSDAMAASSSSQVETIGWISTSIKMNDGAPNATTGSVIP